MIDQRLQRRDAGHKSRLHRKGRLPPQRGTKRTHEEIKRADVDRAQHRDQPGQIEPRRQPPPPAATENRTPMVQRAGRRKGRSDLSHGQRKNQTDKTADQPTDADARTTHPGNTLVDGVDAARQNADDGERYRKI